MAGLPGAKREAERRAVELYEKLEKLKIRLPGYDPSDHISRGVHWDLSCQLSAYSATGNIKAARAIDEADAAMAYRQAERELEMGIFR